MESLKQFNWACFQDKAFESNQFNLFKEFVTTQLGVRLVHTT